MAQKFYFQQSNSIFPLNFFKYRTLFCFHFMSWSRISRRSKYSFQLAG